MMINNIKSARRRLSKLYSESELKQLDRRQLEIVAECHDNDGVAKSAMKLLREKFDKTYMWCTDCDGLVTTEANCCMNRKPDVDNEF
ncbi:MAG: hypothetical protein AAF620_15320 [Bacteroidota bacterium]